MSNLDFMKIPFSTQSIQVAFFLGNIDLSNRLSVASLIQKELSPKLNGTPTILPIPDDAPLEIPRIILISKDKNLTCNIAANRLDLSYKETDEKKPLEKIEKDFFKVVQRLAKITFTSFSMTSNRLGLVTKYKVSQSINGMELLKKNYLGNPKDASTELQIHRLFIEKIGDFKTNNWIRLISKKGNKEKELFLVISDINTSKTIKYKIDFQKAMAFFSSAFELSVESTLASLRP